MFFFCLHSFWSWKQFDLFPSQAHECRELELQAWNVITENFDAVSENPEFLEMAVDSLLEVIKYDDIQVAVQVAFIIIFSFLY